MGKAVGVIRVVPLVVFTVVAVSVVRVVVDEDIQQAISKGAASLTAYYNVQGLKDYIAGHCPRSSTSSTKAGAGAGVSPNSSTRSSYVRVANETVGKLLDVLRRNGSVACHNEVTAGFEFEGLPAREWWPVVIGVREALRFRIVSLAADGHRRCFGGDSYEADLSGERWKSRPTVEDAGDGSYAVTVMLLGGNGDRDAEEEEEEEEEEDDDDDDDAEEEEGNVDDYGFLAGPYVLTVSLLYSNFHSLDQGTGDHNTVDRAIRAMNRTVQMQVQVERTNDRRRRRRRQHRSSSSRCKRRGGSLRLPRRCGQQDMEAWQPAVTGRWTRPVYNRSCSAEPHFGRFDGCFRGNCTAAWCDGRLSRLESNGWVYSRPGCRFHIWEAADAWDCLSGRWLFFWGDSNLQDFIRNILLFALDYPPPQGQTLDKWTLRRDVDERFVNPVRPEQTVRLSLAFNGGPVITQDYQGLHSLRNATYRQRLWNHYLNTAPPTANSSSSSSSSTSSNSSRSSSTADGATERPYAFIFNSGIHDGRRYYSLDKYIDAVDFAASFWEGLLAASSPEHVVLRWSVATAADIGRYSPSNPAKLEALNQALLLRFYRSFPHLRLLDAFDLTFPFHYDHCCSDGGHYGRSPKHHHRPWFGKAYNQYFLDVMLVHMLLTSICPLPAT